MKMARPDIRESKLSIGEYYEKYPRTVKQTEETRREILASVPRNAKISNELLEYLFQSYDETVFGGRIEEYLRKHHEHITLTGNSHMSHISGRTTEDGHRYSMEFSTQIFDNLKVSKNRPQNTGGIECTSEIECLMITFEHELVHVLMILGFAGPNDNHGPSFQRVLKNIFKHKKIQHNLLDDKQYGRKFYQGEDFRHGETVRFHYGNKVLTGEILRLDQDTAAIQSGNRLLRVKYDDLRVIQK